MRIETEVKLDFKDVLIRPKRSTLSTRSNVDISREFRFRHAGVEYHGVPIVAAKRGSMPVAAAPAEAPDGAWACAAGSALAAAAARVYLRMSRRWVVMFAF